jgi:DNA polymerase-3 subunit epsilon
MQSAREGCEGIVEASCFGACKGKESPEQYNERVQQAIRSMQEQPSYAIVDKGINGDDRSCILVWEGKFYGMGYIPGDIQISDAETLKDHLTVYKENSFIRNLVNGYAARFPGKVMKF